MQKNDRVGRDKWISLILECCALTGQCLYRESVKIANKEQGFTFLGCPKIDVHPPVSCSFMTCQ